MLYYYEKNRYGKEYCERFDTHAEFQKWCRENIPENYERGNYTIQPTFYEEDEITPEEADAREMYLMAEYIREDLGIPDEDEDEDEDEE